MLYYFYSFILFMMMINLLLLSLLMFFYNYSIVIEWMIFNLQSMSVKFIIYLDWMSLIFIFTILMISFLVSWYSKEYMEIELKNKYFIMILISFIISMILMIISPNMFSVILGWDGLGLTSYCLIIYYQNYSSFNKGMLTLLMNRIGDIMLIIMICLMINFGSWNLIFYKFKNFYFFLLLLLMMMTKSAQIPFSMWLPAAMAAPTPVSSLVHSSTLVTAGIYLIIRFNKLFMLNKMNFIMMFIGLITMLYSSIWALLEFDLKKIIAYSTLSQLGLMMTSLSFNLINFTFFHLISHAMFKSLLFLCSGVIIHMMNNNQDIRFMGSLMSENPLLFIFLIYSMYSLSGFFFLSGFYSKDLIYEMILNFNLNIYIFYFMYLCISLTVMYNFRLIYYLIINFNMYKSYMFKYIYNSMMLKSMMLLFFMTIIFGNLINWVFFDSLSLSLVSLKFKFMLYLMMFFGLLILLLLLIFNFFMNLKNYNFLNFIMMSFFMLNLTLSMNWKIIYCMKFMNLLSEKLWNEIFMYKMTKFFLYKFNKILIYSYMINKMTSLINLMILIIILMILHYY